MNNMKRWFKTSPENSPNGVVTAHHSTAAGNAISNSIDNMINGSPQKTAANSTYFFRGDDLLDGYYQHAVQLRKEIDECKPQIRQMSESIVALSKTASILSRTVDRSCDTAQVWPAALRTYRTLHKHMHDTSQTTFAATFVDDVNDVYDQWLDECKQFLRELKRTNDNRSKRDDSKHLVDSLFEEKVEGRREWTEEQERTLQAAKAQLGKECTVYDGMVAGLKSHFEELCVNRMRCMDVVFEHLLAQEFTLFRPLIKAMRQADGGDDNSMNSPIGFDGRNRSVQSPSSPLSSSAHKLRFNPMQNINRSRFGDKHGNAFDSGKHTLFGAGLHDVMNSANNLHMPTGSQGDAALMETVSLLQHEIVKREATEAEIQQLREQISALQSVETSVEQQAQLAELRRQLDHPDRQIHSQTITGDASSVPTAPPPFDDGQMVIGAGAPPPPGAADDRSSEMVIGTGAPPPPPMPGAPDAPPLAPGAPPPPGPPPPSFQYGAAGLSINKKPLQQIRKLTPREQEIADAKKYELPLFPSIHPSENVLLKKIHWQTIPAADIKNTIWADIVIPKHDVQINNFVPLLSDTPDDQIHDLTKDESDTTDNKEVEPDTAGLHALSYNWQLDTSEFESTFAQRAAVAMKKRVPKGKQYKIGERRDKKKENGDEKTVSSDSDDDDSDEGGLTLHDEDAVDENGNRIQKVPKALPKIELIDPKRAYNVSISLSRFKMSYEQLRDSVMTFDDSVLTLEMIDVLCEILPQPDEMATVKAYTGNIDRLGDVEQFFLTMSVPGLVARLKSFVLLLSFSQVASAIQDAIDTVGSAYSTINTSGEIRTLLGILLRFGNYLNAQNKLPQVYGFTLTSLGKIRGIKTLDNKSTLLHYVVNYVNEHTPQTRAFVQQLEVCRPASRVESAYLIAEVKQMTQNLRILDSLINEDTNRQIAAEAGKAPVNEKYQYIPLSKKVYEFHKYATARVHEIDTTLQKLLVEYNQLAKLFMVSDMKWEEFFNVWTVFADEYTVCEQDIQIVIEMHQRKEKQIQALELIKQRQANKSNDNSSANNTPANSTPSDSPQQPVSYRLSQKRDKHLSQNVDNTNGDMYMPTSSVSPSPGGSRSSSPNFNKPLPPVPPGPVTANPRRATINALSPIVTDKSYQ